jgi:hypothetical protein
VLMSCLRMRGRMTEKQYFEQFSGEPMSFTEVYEMPYMTIGDRAFNSKGVEITHKAWHPMGDLTFPVYIDGVPHLDSDWVRRHESKKD